MAASFNVLAKNLPMLTGFIGFWLKKAGLKAQKEQKFG